MIGMQRIQATIRRVVAPITIMFIPHHNASKSINLNISTVSVFLSIVLCCAGVVYLSMATIDIIKYRRMDREIREYAKKVADFKVALASLKKTEKELYRLVSLGSREKILENIEASDMGAVDMGAIDIKQIQEQIALSTKAIGAIRDYLRAQRDIYLTTPKGWPVQGRITSPFGRRINPVSGRAEFHRAVDIAAPKGTPILATAEGIVSFSGWTDGGGNVVVVEHGHGFSTYYAHNNANAVDVGQTIRRGDVIGYVGTTGSSTGSHVHYEVWLDERAVNPFKYLHGRS